MLHSLQYSLLVIGSPHTSDAFVAKALNLTCEPNLSVINKLFFPIGPIPASAAASFKNKPGL